MSQMSQMIKPLMQIGGTAATAMGQPEIGVPLQMGSSLMGGGQGGGGGGNPLSMLFGQLGGQLMGKQQQGPMAPPRPMMGGAPQGGLPPLMGGQGMGGSLAGGMGGLPPQLMQLVMGMMGGMQ